MILKYAASKKPFNGTLVIVSSKKQKENTNSEYRLAQFFTRTCGISKKLGTKIEIRDRQNPFVMYLDGTGADAWSSIASWDYLEIPAYVYKIAPELKSEMTSFLTNLIESINSGQDLKINSLMK